MKFVDRISKKEVEASQFRPPLFVPKGVTVTNVALHFHSFPPDTYFGVTANGDKLQSGDWLVEGRVVKQADFFGLYKYRDHKHKPANNVDR